MKSNAGSATRSASQVLRRFAAPVVAAAALLAAQAAGVAAASPEATAATRKSSCPDVQVVFARGTFEAPGVGVTGIHEFAGRGHSLTIDHGWHDVADTTLAWMAHRQVATPA